MLERVLIAARGGGGSVRRRIAALERWYGLRAELREVAGGAVVIAALGGPVRGAAFGEAPPATLDLLGADERTLRRYEGGGVAVAATADRARIVAGAGAPAVLYTAASDGVQAWSTHAVAAAYVSTGSVSVDPGAAAELLAAEFVGDGRSLVAGVRAMTSASLVDLTGIRADEGCYWPARDRWRLVPEEDAYAYTELQLVRSLEARMAGVDRALVGLTAGPASRVAALALRELGIPFTAFTVGAADHDDVEGGAQAARALGVGHEQIAPAEWDGAEALARVRSAARWTEGAMHVGFAGVPWPDDADALVTGAGAETGRCFYYRDRIRERLPGDLAEVVMESLAERAAGARPEATHDVEQSVRSWVAAAERAGATGWSVLDVLCAEQRVRRRGRALLPPPALPTVGALAAPEVQRGLISMSLEDRARDEFAHRFIAARKPDLEPPRTRRPPAARGTRGGPLDVSWTASDPFREWVADTVLGGPLALDAMGERWCRRTRSRFYAGDAAATHRALWLAGPVSLQEATAELAAD